MVLMMVLQTTQGKGLEHNMCWMLSVNKGIRDDFREETDMY